MLKELTGGIGQQTIVTQQKGGLYKEIFEYAKDDFFSIADMNKFYGELSRYLNTFELQLTQIMAQLATHTHTAPGGLSPAPTSPPVTTVAWNKIVIPGVTPLLVQTFSATPNTKPGINSIVLNGSPIVLAVPSKLTLDLALPTVPPIMNAML